VKKKLELLKLQIKSAFISIPRILLGTVVLAIVVVFVGLGISFANARNNEDKLQVAVVYDESNDDAYVQMAFNIISGIDSVNKLCEFVWTDEDEAIEGLKRGKYAVAMILPDNLVHNIMVGENTPVEIVYPSVGVNNSSVLFREMVTAGGSDLSAAEAGTYTMDDLLARNGLLKSFRSKRAEYEDELNEIFMSYGLNRSIYFRETDLAQADGLSNIQFYVCSAVLMLFLLSGITCANNLKNDSKALSIVLKAQGIHAFETGICKVTGITLVYFLITTVVYSFANLMRVSMPLVGTILKANSFLGFLGAFLGLFILLFAVFSFIYCIFKIVRNPVYSVLVLFLVSMICMYASGCFVSSALLPHIVRSIGGWLPTTGFFRLIGQIINGTVTFGCLVINVFIAVVCQGIAAIVEKYRRF